MPWSQIADRAAAVLALRDRALERGVAEGVVLDLHRQPLDRRIERRPLGDRPALEHAVGLEPEIVVQVRGVVLLDDEDRLLVGCGFTGPGRLAGLGKSRLARYSFSGMARRLSGGGGGPDRDNGRTGLGRSRRHSLGRLVGAEPLEAGLAEQPVLRPLGEGDLGHQLGLTQWTPSPCGGSPSSKGLASWPSSSNRLRRSSSASRV